MIGYCPPEQPPDWLLPLPSSPVIGYCPSRAALSLAAAPPEQPCYWLPPLPSSPLIGYTPLRVLADHVALEVLGPGSPVGTVGTLVGPVSRVDPQVVPQVTCVSFYGLLAKGAPVLSVTNFIFP